jgi:2,4-dienoyl-CoA reductase-like NADH-dependent reductase (Old Yellow Enzyme family)
VSSGSAEAQRVDTSPLFTPFSLRSVTLRNRFVLPAMQRGWGSEGKPQPRLAEYYRSRAAGGIALVISESCAVDHPAATANRFSCHIREATYDAWVRCVEAVHGAGGLFFQQLWHEGAKQGRRDAGITPVSPSGLVQAGRRNGDPATPQQLGELRDAFVRSALIAERAGADGVEVHAAHGYLLDQFLWAETNRRDDGLGGDDMADRVKFPAQVVAAVRAALKPSMAISLRFSQWKTIDYNAKVAQTPEELGVMLGALAEAGVDVFHASTRRFWEPAWPELDRTRTLSGWCKTLTSVPVIAVGSVGLSTDHMTSILRESEGESTGEVGMGELLRRFEGGEFDLVSVGRSVIGDPDWVWKVRDGRYADIRTFSYEDIAMEWDSSELERVKKLRTGEAAPGA